MATQAEPTLVVPESGLRTRYRPRTRIGHGTVAVAVWVDLVLLLLFFVLLTGRFVLQPGIVVELPTAPFRDGARAIEVAVVLSVPGAVPGLRDDIVFFDDERFVMSRPGQREALQQSFARLAARTAPVDLTLEADRRVLHGTVLDIMDIALEVGVGKVNLATRPESSGP